MHRTVVQYTTVNIQKRNKIIQAKFRRRKKNLLD